MAYIQRTTPPPNNIEYFANSDFSGGLNNVDAYMEIAENESTNLLNVDIFREQGVAWQRGGTEYKDVIDLGAPVTLVDEWINGTPSIVRASDTELYSGSVKVADLVGRAQGLPFQKKYIFVDGGIPRIIGSFPQTPNTYTVIVGTPTVDDVVMEIKGEQVAYAPLDATHDIGVTTYDYTNGFIYYDPCQNELDDFAKGANFVATTPTCISQKEGRLYMSGDDDLPYSIFISDIQNPYYFPVSVGLQITPRGNEITTLIEFHDAMVVCTKESLHAIYGNTNRTDLNSDLYYMKDLNTHTGVANPATVKRVMNYVYYLGNDGEVYSMYTPKTDTNQIMTTVLSRKVNLFEEPIAITTDDFANACAVYYRDYYWLSFGSKVMVYSYMKQAWTMYDSLNITSFLVMDYQLLFGNVSGRLVRYDNAIINDLDLAIVTFWKSKRFSMGYPSRIKKFKNMYVIVHTFDTTDSTVKVSFEVDYDDIEKTSIVKNAISRWGEAVFGDRFISRNINKSLPLNINRRGRLISFTFANDVIDETMRVYEVNGEYELRGFR